MPAPLSLLGLGILLGGSVTWFALRPSPSAGSTHANSAVVTAPVSLPAWSWRDSATPPTLARDDAAAAIFAWRSLRDPAGRPASFAVRASGLRALLLRLPPEAFPRLLEPLVSSDNDDDRRLLPIAFSAWTTADAPAAAQWIAARLAAKSEDRLFGLAYEAIRAWTTKDPAAAATWACALPDLALARRLAGIPLSELAKKNPDRALALARSRDTAFRDSVLSSVLGALGQKDPAGTLRTFAPELWKNGEGFNSLRGVISAWIKQDSSAALAWLFAQPRDGDHQLAYWLSSFDDNSKESRTRLANTLATTPGLANRAGAMRDLLYRWSNDKPEEALAWLNTLADPDLRIDLLERISSYSSNTPQKSLPLALAMPEGANRSQRLSRVLGAWAKIDSDAALAWMREHGSEPGVAEASHAVHGVLLADLAREDPQAALAEWQALSDPKARSTAVSAIARAWGQKDPAAAFQWAEAQNNNNPAHRSFGGNNELLFKWSQTDPEAAVRWVENWTASLPEEQRHMSHYYFEAFGGTWNERAPRAPVADLLAKIQDPHLRSRQLANHLREWLTKDPDAARAWTQASPALTPEQRDQILAPVK